MTISLDPSTLGELNSKQAKALHGLLNELRSCGVGNIVNLPQIVVVGEQSAGKSSVLEAISHVRFPVKGDLCTRFATELVLRHASQTRVDVSIQYADKSKPSHRFERTNFSENDLPDIIAEAKSCMGVAATGRDFSSDILRLEIEGPSMYPLTLVDLPGLFHVDTADQSMHGKNTVDSLVERYMKQKNSIILVVITASNQLANHVALRLVKEHDPSRERTLGVITKPDLTRPGYTDERNYIQLAKNQEKAHKLKLGWHVLRNRAEDEESLDERDAIEISFFEKTAWHTLPPHDRGVAALRRKLSQVLYEHTRHNLQGVIEDIQDKVEERREELLRLGTKRPEFDDQQSFLLEISCHYQRLAQDGVRGTYNDPFFGGLEDREHKLRSQLRNLNRAFDYILSTKGSKMIIRESETSGAESPDAPDFLKEFLEEYPYDFPDPEPIDRDVLDKQLQAQAASNQGTEFPGIPNKDLVIQLFQKQATPWKDIATFHVTYVSLVAKAFVDRLFQHIIGHPDTNITTEQILCTVVDPWFAKKDKLLQDKLHELLQPYELGYAMPLDSEFHRAISTRLAARLTGKLPKLVDDQLNDMVGNAISKESRSRLIEILVSKFEDVEGGEFGSQKIIDMMEAYYEMSRRTFTDNVVNLAIETCLIRDIPNILTPKDIYDMTKDQLNELAAEPEEVKCRREELDREVKILEKGLEKCRTSQPRSITVVSSTTSKKLTQPSESKSDLSGLTYQTTPLVPKNRRSSDLIRQSPLPTGFGSPTASIPTSSSSPPGGLFARKAPWSESPLFPSTKKPMATPSPVSSNPSTLNDPVTPLPSKPFSFNAPLTVNPWMRFASTMKEKIDNSNGEVTVSWINKKIPTMDNSREMAPSEKEANSSMTNKFRNLCFNPLFKDFSPEEIRLATYQANPTIE